MVAQIALGLSMSFGALMIPFGYLLCWGRTAALSRWMLLGVSLQVCWSVCVYVFVWYNWWAGHSEYYWGYALFYPVNGVGFLYYCCTPFLPRWTSKPAT